MVSGFGKRARGRAAAGSTEEGFARAVVRIAMPAVAGAGAGAPQERRYRRVRLVGPV